MDILVDQRDEFLTAGYVVFEKLGHSIFYPHPPYGRQNLAIFETALSESAVSIIRKCWKQQF